MLKEELQTTFGQIDEDDKIFTDHITQERKEEIQNGKLKLVRMWLIFVFLTTSFIAFKDLG